MKPVLKSIYLGMFVKITLTLMLIGGLMVIYVDHQVREKFEGKRWKIPAKVYAQPLELYVGAKVSRQHLIEELALLGYRRVEKVRGPGSYAVVGSSVNVYTRGFRFWDGLDPGRRVEVVFRGGGIEKLVEKGASLGILRLEPYQIGGIYSAEKEDRQLVALADVPVMLLQTLIAVEDRQYYQHAGISVKGITRAMIANAKSGSVVQGGSTITQQLVKNFYLNDERTITRKAIEALMSLLLELHYSKEEILQAYLNEVYLGQHGNWAIHGVGLASYFYFNQPLTDLDAEQLALLVAIIKGPSYYSPVRNPARAMKRRNRVLDVMAQKGIIDAESLQSLKQRPLGLSEKRGYVTNRFPAFLDLVKRQLKEVYAPEDLESEGLRIFTTLNPTVQIAAEKALASQLKAFQKRAAVDADKLEGSMIVTSPENGEVLALIGGRNPTAKGFNRALDARRQVGSIIKPVVYLAALEKKDRYQLTTFVDDRPFTLTLPNGEEWKPTNFDRQSHGRQILLEALVNSYNQATARLAVELGIEEVVDTLWRLGVKRPIKAVPALSLGAVELSALEVAKIYQTIAANGFSSRVGAIREILDGEGEPLKRYPLEVKQVVDRKAVNLIQFALQSVMDRGTGASAYQSLPDSLGLAGKTGTTNALRDSWFAGMSGDYLAAVWLGRDDNEPTGLTGSTGALRVWTDLMKRLDPKPYRPVFSPELEILWISPESGRLFPKPCVDSIRVLVDPEGEGLIKASCFRERIKQIIYR